MAAADIQNNPASTNEQTVNGAYAWVITDSGIVYLVNINPVLRGYNAVVPVSHPPPTPHVSVATAPPGVTESEPFVNTLRDRNVISYSITLDPSSGPPRVDVLPSAPVTGPYIEPFWTQGSILNATAVSPCYVQTVVFFPQESPSPSNFQDPIDRRGSRPRPGRSPGRGPCRAFAAAAIRWPATLACGLPRGSDAGSRPIRCSRTAAPTTAPPAWSRAIW